MSRRPGARVVELAAAGSSTVIAGSLALVITATLGVLLFRPRQQEPGPWPEPAASLPQARREPRGAEPLPAPPAPAPEAMSGSPPAAVAASAAAGGDPGAWAELQRRFPALEGVTWPEVAREMLAAPAPNHLPRALRSLALELAGTVRTMAGSGAGELTHPAVLSRILDEVLAGSAQPLSPAQREQAAELAARGAAELDRLLAAASRPRLATIVAEVEVKLEIVDALSKVLAEPQREVLDRLVTGDAAALSPLALIESRALAGADAAAFRRSFALELEREFEVDPALAVELAAQFAGRLAPLFAASGSDMTQPERALIAARAQAQTLEALLCLPGLSAGARERVVGVHTAIVPGPR